MYWLNELNLDIGNKNRRIKSWVGYVFVGARKKEKYWGAERTNLKLILGARKMKTIQSGSRVKTYICRSKKRGRIQWSKSENQPFDIRKRRNIEKVKTFYPFTAVFLCPN